MIEFSRGKNQSNAGGQKGRIIVDRKIEKQKILIVDHLEENRDVLAQTLQEDYEILTAKNSMEAVMILKKSAFEISLMLLDIAMPGQEAFRLLKIMTEESWSDRIPVVMITTYEISEDVEKAYEMGVIDRILQPLDDLIVRHRIGNIIKVFTKQWELVEYVSNQVYENEMDNRLLIHILSQIVEFRSGENSRHVANMQDMVEMLLTHLRKKSDRYFLSEESIATIVAATALHDIGKVAIPDHILNKPGKYTEDEFALMKQHSVIGCTILENLPVDQEASLVHTAHEICRWHHERYDGNGYPDGLFGEAIPIAAQVVSLADVYDALTSQRVYKKAYTHEEAIRMILNGECGVFNPLLLECLDEISCQLKEKLSDASSEFVNKESIYQKTMAMMKDGESGDIYRSAKLLTSRERDYYFADMSSEIRFEFTFTPAVLTFSEWSAEKLQVDMVIEDPVDNWKLEGIFDPDIHKEIRNKLRRTTAADPVFQYDFEMSYGKEKKWSRATIRSIWSEGELSEIVGAIGKIVPLE